MLVERVDFSEVAAAAAGRRRPGGRGHQLQERGVGELAPAGQGAQRVCQRLTEGSSQIGAPVILRREHRAAGRAPVPAARPHRSRNRHPGDHLNG